MLILASGSPRRKILLQNLIADFRIVVPEIDESAVAARRLTPQGKVRALSREKAKAVARKFPQDSVLAADTVVAQGLQVLGKPRDREEAAAMLRALSGKTHSVWTGVTLLRSGRAVTYAVRTRVRFRRLSEEEISSYAASGEGLDKAGAYGIQGKAGDFVESLRGEYFNVVGLPLRRLSCLLG